jgi:hypothetical protein
MREAGKLLREIGEELGVSKERARQMVSIAGRLRGFSRREVQQRFARSNAASAPKSRTQVPVRDL